jgi:hypothetical protein
MSHLKQFSYIIKDNEFRNGPHISNIKIVSPPFQHPKELIGIVNQNGVLKIHGIINENKEKVENEFVMAGTGATIPPELIDRLYRVGSVLVGDGQYGYHCYILLDPRGIPEEGSDVGVEPKFKVTINLNAEADEDDLEALVDFVNLFCAEHKGVLRTHQQAHQDHQLEVHGYNDVFRHDQAFHNFMGQLYKSSVIDDIILSKSV